MDGKRVLITGASGFVGRWLLPALRRHFPAAVLIGCSNEGEIEGADLVLPLDLTRPDSIEACIVQARPDSVIHLAAESAVSLSYANPRRTWQVNLTGTLELASAVMRLAPEAQFVFASTAEAYGLSFQSGNPLDESSAFVPASPYAASKAAADVALGEMGLRGLRAVRLRLFNHTGPGQSDTFVIAAFARQIARIERGLQDPVIKVGALDRWRDFLDVRDVCDAYGACLSRDRDIAPGTAINIASGLPRRIGDVLQALIARSAATVEVQSDAARMRPTEILSATASVDRARTLLGWQPAIAWDETLDAVLGYWRERTRQDAA